MPKHKAQEATSTNGEGAGETKRLKLLVIGTHPLLMHNPAGMKRVEETLGKKKIPTPEAEAASGLYKLPNGDLYLRTIAFRRALEAASVGLRIGKRSATSIVRSCVMPATETTTVLDPETLRPIRDYEIDTRRVVIQDNGIMRSRPMFRRWAAEVELEYESDFINEDVILKVAALAGRVVGVGDYRPQTGGPFGRFRVERAK